MVAKSSTRVAKKQAPAAVVAAVETVAVVAQEEVDDIQVTFDDSALLDGIDSSEDEQDTFAPIPQPDTIASNSAIVALTSDTATSDAIISKIKKAKKERRAAKEVPGSIYLGRIPLGFEEKQIRSYFSQFGVISRMRLSRNRKVPLFALFLIDKTGKSKHFAFIEFKSCDVARIVAETMNNYLIFGHIMKCKVVEASQLHADVYKHANESFKAIPWTKVQRLSHNRVRTAEEVERNSKKLDARHEEKKAKIAALGINFTFPTKVVC